MHRVYLDTFQNYKSKYRSVEALYDPLEMRVTLYRDLIKVYRVWGDKHVTLLYPFLPGALSSSWMYKELQDCLTWIHPKAMLHLPARLCGDVHKFICALIICNHNLWVLYWSILFTFIRFHGNQASSFHVILLRRQEN